MKQQILDAIIRQLEQNLSRYRRQMDTLDSGADIDEEETIDLDKHSQQDEASTMSNLLQQPQQVIEDTIALIKTFGLIECNRFASGALIETDENYLLIGVPLPPLKVNDKKVIGITTDAPVYRALEDKRKGDELHLGNKDYLILSVS